MTSAPVGPSSGARDSAFGALATAVLGLVLLEIGFILLNSTLTAHMFNLLIGGMLISLSLRRFWQYWPSTPQQSSNVGRGTPLQIWCTIVISCALIGGGGYIVADALVYGFVFPFTLFAIGLVLMPWTRIARTRMHCVGYWTVSTLGIGIALLANASQLNPIFFLLVTGFLWMSTIAAWLRSVIAEKEGQRRGASSTEVRPHRATGNASHALTGEAVVTEMPITDSGSVRH